MIKIYLVIFTTSLIFSSVCKNPINIASSSPLSLLEIISIITNECKISLVIEDDISKKNLSYKFNSVYIENKTLDETLSYLLNERFYYKLDKNLLTISYLANNTFFVNYINSTRLLTNAVQSKQKKESNEKEQTATSLTSKDENNFWENLEKQLEKIIKKNKDAVLIVDKNTGNIFLRANKKISKIIKNYLNAQKNKLYQQVLINMNIYNVSLKDGSKEGINWSLLQDIQSFNLSGSLQIANGQSGGSLNVGKKLNVRSIVDFINTFGSTSSISNPKLLILNKQPAIISIGDDTYYKIKKSTTSQSQSTITTNSEEILSVFSGVLISITPSIENDTIILKIHQEVSSLKQQETSTDILATNIPPNRTKNEISTIIKLKNQEKAILGGLISKDDVEISAKLPLLGSIPFIGFLFTNKQMKKISNELIIVIEAKIIK